MLGARPVFFMATPPATPSPGRGGTSYLSPPPPINYHQRISSDLPFGTKFNHPSGVFFVSDSTLTKTPYHYWLADIALWADVVQYFKGHGFDTFSFCPYSTRAAFESIHANIPLQRDPILSTGQSQTTQVSQSPFRTSVGSPPYSMVLNAPSR